MSSTASARLTICLRCRFRLGRHGQLLRRGSMTTTKSAPLSTLTRLDVPTAGNEPEKRHCDLRRKEFVKHRGRPGLRTEQRSAVYEHTSGEPSEVIVIRDSMRNPTGSFYGDTFISDTVNKWESVSSGTENYTLTKLVADLEAERVAVDQDIVNAHIESLRPKVTLVFSGKGFADLADVLYNSFTQAQLVDYITHAKARPLDGLGDRTSPPAQDQASTVIMGQTTWKPGDTPFLETEQEPTGPPNISSNMKKRNVVEYLLQKCWGIILDDAIGQMQLHLKPHELSLLLRESASHGFLKNYSEKYNCRIDISRSLQVVRITATMSTAHLFADKMKQTLEGIRCTELDMTPFLPLKQGVKGVDMVDKSLVQAVSDFTDTDIREGADSNKLNIYYFAESPHAPQIVTRLLLAPLKLPSRTEYALLSSSESDTALYQMGPGVDLPWNERAASWSRYRSIAIKQYRASEDTERVGDNSKQLPLRSKRMLVARLRKFLKLTELKKQVVNREDNYQEDELDQEEEDNAAINHESLLAGTDISEIDTGKPACSGQVHLTESTARKQKNPKFLAAKWTDTCDTVVTATLGQVLHSTAGQSPVHRLGRTRLLSQNVDRSFLAGVAGLSNLLGTLRLREELSKEFMNLRFIPSPWMTCGLDGGTRFPYLEFNVEIDPVRHRPKFASVHAFVEDNITDLMLPERQADLRFRKRSRYRLRRFALDQNIKEFKELSELQPGSGKMLWTPPSLKLKIPKRLISGNAGIKHELVTDYWGEECVLVDYLFTGLDVRQVVRFDIDGWKATYTEVEAGKAGGRRVEFSMVMDRPQPVLDGHDHIVNDGTEGSKHELPSDFSAFFDSTQHLVDMLEDPDLRRPLLPRKVLLD